MEQTIERAFPGGSMDFSDTERPPFNSGMTLLDYFAAQALCARYLHTGYPDADAKRVYDVAEAMLVERKTRMEKLNG